jgi:hypothetical protein
MESVRWLDTYAPPGMLTPPPPTRQLFSEFTAWRCHASLDKPDRVSALTDSRPVIVIGALNARIWIQ